MTPADAPNASDRPLAATKPREDFAAEPTDNASRTRRVPAPAQRQPGAHSIIGCLRLKASRFGPLDNPRSPSPAPFDPHSSRRRATV